MKKEKKSYGLCDFVVDFLKANDWRIELHCHFTYRVLQVLLPVEDLEG